MDLSVKIKNLLVIFLLFSFFAAIFSCSSKSSDEQISKSLEKGKKLFKEKKYTEAKKLFQKVVETKPNSQEAHYYLGYTLDRIHFGRSSGLEFDNPNLCKKVSKEFERVVDIKPTYNGEVYILSPYSKITSQWGSLATYYFTQNDLDSAKWAFQEGKNRGGFLPFVMESNKNRLRSCQNNAILFTNGDMDTYPAWCSQFMDDFRRDVTVVNLSLLNAPRYIKYTKNRAFFSQNNIDINMTEEKIEDLKPRRWSTQEISVETADSLSEMKWDMEPTIKDKGIRIQDLLVWKIIQENNWNRPIYFANTVAKTNFIGLKKAGYLEMQGMVYRLFPYKSNGINKFRQNITDKYQYKRIRNSDKPNTHERIRLADNYRKTFLMLVKKYNEKEKYTEAIKTLSTMQNKIPLETIPTSNSRFENYIKKICKENLEGASTQTDKTVETLEDEYNLPESILD